MELISRDEAIKTARMMIGLTADERENEIRAIPTVEERNEGKWETVNFKMIPTDRISKAKKCSECGKRKDKYVVWNYCPNCGAKMKGE